VIFARVAVSPRTPTMKDDVVGFHAQQAVKKATPLR